MALADLLLAARLVELHQLDHARVVEVSHGGIVEREVAVLTDAEAAKIDGLRSEQFRVALAFAEGQQGVAFKVMEVFRFQSCFNTFAHVLSEAGRMICIDAQVLVHVKERDARPIHTSQGHQRVEKLELRVASRKDRENGLLSF